MQSLKRLNRARCYAALHHLSKNISEFEFQSPLLKRQKKKQEQIINNVHTEPNTYVHSHQAHNQNATQLQSSYIIGGIRSNAVRNRQQRH